MRETAILPCLKGNYSTIHMALAWLGNSSAGHCGYTSLEASNDCEADPQGAFLLSAEDCVSWSKAVDACLVLCAKCAGCHHISVSLKHRDYSWYRTCERPVIFDDLRHGRVPPQARSASGATPLLHPRLEKRIKRCRSDFVRHLACDMSLALAQCSDCPSPLWMDMLTPSLANEHMTYLTIGANKGFGINDWLQRFMAGWNTTTLSWFRAWLDVSGMPDNPGSCGVCGQCTAPPPRVASRAAEVRVVAVEMMSATAAALNGMFGRFGVPGVVVHAAASNSAHAAAFEPENIEAGTEHRGIATTGKRINVTTVDALAHQFALTAIDLLSIGNQP